MSQVIEQELIASTLSGNNEAFDTLIKPYIKPIYNIAYRILNHEEDAKDVCQDSMIKIYKNLKSFKKEAKFSTWVYRIAVNSAKDLIKKRYKNDLSLDKELEDNGDMILLNKSKTNDSPDKILDRKELYNEIFSSIKKLSINHRELIVLRDIQGFSYSEIAEILEKSEGSVKSGINRARKILASDLLAKGIKPSSYERRDRNE